MVKNITFWTTTLLFFLLLVTKCPAQTGDVAIISNSPSVANLQGLGINLYSWTFWGASADYLQNILQNPGFEPSTSGRVVIVPAGVTSTAFCDQISWAPMPSGFYNGATFEDVYVTGAGAGAVRVQPRHWNHHRLQSHRLRLIHPAVCLLGFIHDSGR